jgi:tetratricopeptide (TPR) repeat protein
MPSLLDSIRFKTTATIVIATLGLCLCALLAHRAVMYQRGVWGAGIYAGGDPARAYPYLVNAAQAGLLSGLNAAPLLDLGEVGTWAMDDPAFLKYHPELSAPLAARLALVSYSMALERRPTSSTALAGLADLFRRMGSLKIPAPAPDDQATVDRLVEAAYLKAIEMEPANYFWFAYLADYFVERGQREKALPLYGRAIELMPDLSWHYYLGASGPLPADLFDTAKAALQRSLATNVVFRHEKIESNFGYLYERQRDYDNALEHYRRAVELAADPSQYLYQVAVVLSFQGHDDEAIRYFRRALERGTLGARLEQAALGSLGRIQLKTGDARGAVESLSRARALEPTSYALRLDLGRAYEALGEADEAGAEYRQAISLDPTQPQAYTILIQFYRARRDFARAIPFARRLVEMFPEDANLKSQLDALYREMGGGPETR